jgi:hypothetical protein
MNQLDPATRTAIAMTDSFFGQTLRNHIPDVPTMIVDSQAKTKRLSRLNELSELTDFIGSASLVECKLIINELADRVSTLTGSAAELEDASCALTKEIESEKL